MTDKPNDPRCIECRLVVIEADSMRILTTASAAGPLLPRESIPENTRAAEGLTEALEQRFGLRTIQLAILPGTEELSYCAVHEIMGSQEEVHRLFLFTLLDDIAPSELTEAERATVRKIMKGQAHELGRFARIGWIDELLAKTGGYRGQSSMPVIRQLNQGIDFCLLSITDLTGRKMWFKAVGEPNTREYALTAELTRRFPAYLPRVLTTIPEWNGWVMEDVKGVPLNESDSIYQCEQALNALAFMQKEMVADMASLLTLGAKDWTCGRIASLSEPFFAEAQRAMQAQVSTKSRPLGCDELHQLKDNIELALQEFSDAGIPETLVHGDIGHGNIIATPTGSVFLDWAETYVGHPFLSAEHLLADLIRSSPSLSSSQAALRSHYAAHWKTQVQPADLERVAVFAPAIAAFAYAVIAWDANRSRPDPTMVWPLLRSLLRRSKRELEQVSEVNA
jgi:aminoglycoside phosphotransferase (APT) family kinase protein